MVRLVCGRESRFRLGLSRAHSLTFLDRNDTEFIQNEQNHKLIFIMERLPNNLRGAVAQIESNGRSQLKKMKKFLDSQVKLVWDVIEAVEFPYRCLMTSAPRYLEKSNHFSQKRGPPADYAISMWEWFFDLRFFLTCRGRSQELPVLVSSKNINNFR